MEGERGVPVAERERVRLIRTLRVDREEVSPFLVLKEVFQGRNEYLYKDSKSKGDRHSV